MFQTYKQEIDYNVEEHLVINLWCINEANEPAIVRIEDFYYSFYLAIPEEITGGDEPQDLLKAYRESMSFMLKPNRYHKQDHFPFEETIERRKPFYYFQDNEDYYMHLKFYNKNSCNYAANRLGKLGLKVKGITDKVVATIIEDTISPILKMFTHWGFGTTEWFHFDNVDNYRCNPDEKKSYLDNEYIVSYHNINKKVMDSVHISRPLTMSYDIESYCDHDGQFPDAYNSECVCYMISCTLENLGDPSTREYVLIYIGDDMEIDVDDPNGSSEKPHVEMISCEDETTLLKSFFEVIEVYNPILLTGYNIGGFDNEYIYARCCVNFTMPKSPSLIIGDNSKFIKPRESKFFASKSDSCLFNIGGRLSIDVLDYMKRVYPDLDKHTLDFVANKFIGYTKHDVTAIQMFKAYRDYRTSMLLKSKDNMTDDEFEQWSENLPLEERKWLEREMSEEQRITALEEYKRVSAYCIRDTTLPLDIMKKIDTWTAQVELSKLMLVGIEDLLTQGEQIRCFSQIYNILHNKGFVLKVEKFDVMQSNGGIVTKPLGGIHRNELALDFASLYPSLMRAHNISYETYIPEDRLLPIPPEEEDDKDDTMKERIMKQNKRKNRCIDRSRVNLFNFTQHEPTKVNGEFPKKGTKAFENSKKYIEYNYYIIKKSEYYGELPQLMERLLVERKSLRANIKVYKKEYGSLPIHPPGHHDYDPEVNKRGEDLLLMCSVFEARQLAMKVSMNAIYGFLKVNKGGKMSFPHLSQIITAMGRQSIIKCNDLIAGDLRLLLKPLEVLQGGIPEDFDRKKLLPKFLVDTGGYPACLEEYDLFNSYRSGIIVYNDTDSVYCKFEWIEPQHLEALGWCLQFAFSYIFDDSLILEYEQILLVCVHVTKKRYTGIIMNTKTGTALIDESTGKSVQYTKGLVTAKRSGTQYQRNIMDAVCYNVLNDGDLKSTMTIIVDWIYELIYDGIEAKDLCQMNKIAAAYKDQSYFLNVFRKRLEKDGRPVRSGEKVEYTFCLVDKQLNSLKTKGARSDTVKTGQICYLLSEVTDEIAPPIDKLSILSKTAAAIDQFFSACFGGNRYLNNNGIQKRKGSKMHLLTNPMNVFSIFLEMKEREIYKKDKNIERWECEEILQSEISE